MIEILDGITTLATLPAIFALVELGKRLGASGYWSMLLAVLFGVGLSVADFMWASEPLYQAIAGGLILGLGAAGVYDLTQGASPRRAIGS